MGSKSHSMSHLRGLPASRCPDNGSLSNSFAELYLRRIGDVDAVKEQLEDAVRLATFGVSGPLQIDVGYWTSPCFVCDLRRGFLPVSRRELQ